MENKEILEKAIRKAIKGGWLPYQSKVKTIYVNNYRYEDDHAGELKTIIYTISYDNGSGLIAKTGVHELIFNHDFAKALWGEEKLDRYNLETDTAIDSLWDGGPEYFDFLGKTWQYHLQQMVISDDPIKYLGGNLNV